MKTKVLFNAGDKAIFDAMNQHGITKDAVQKFFLSRGIIISPSTDRRVLALYFSRMVHDYRDYRFFADLLQPVNRRERLASKLINECVDLNALSNAAEKLKNSIEEEGGSAKIITRDNGDIVLQATYVVENFNRTQLKQKTTKRAEIIIERVSDGVTVRYQANAVVDEWACDLISLAEKEGGNRLEVREVSLSHISSPEFRSKFFIELIHRVRDFKFYDVTDVYVYHPKIDDESLGDEETDDVDIGVHISKASLKGEGVLQSQELNSLYKRGFFISKIIWQSSRSSSESDDLYEFEAQFSQPESFTQFTYLTRGFYRRSDSGELSSSRTPLSDNEEAGLNKELESAAWRALSAVEASTMESEVS